MENMMKRMAIPDAADSRRGG